MMVKICARCKESKDIEMFSKRSSAKDGRNYYCKQCESIKSLKYRDNNKYEIKKRKINAYLLANKDKIIEKRKEYYQENKETIKAQRHGYYLKNSTKQIEQKMIKRYNLSMVEYNEILDKQGGVCAICGAKESAKDPRILTGGVRKLCIDHDHTTGKIRGLLCGACNRAIGYFRDNPEYMIMAAAYINKNGGRDE